jgi:hypothetical protein
MMNNSTQAELQKFSTQTRLNHHERKGIPYKLAALPYRRATSEIPPSRICRATAFFGVSDFFFGFFGGFRAGRFGVGEGAGSLDRQGVTLLGSNRCGASVCRTFHAANNNNPRSVI